MPTLCCVGAVQFEAREIVTRAVQTSEVCSPHPEVEEVTATLLALVLKDVVLLVNGNVDACACSINT